MVERRGAGDHPRRAGPQRAVDLEHAVVQREQAGGVDVPGSEGAGRVLLTADVVAVLAAEHVEHPHGDVTIGIEAGPAQLVQRQQGGLR